MRERGVSEDGDSSGRGTFAAKFGCEGFRRNFSFGSLWRGRRYHMKQVEVFATWEDGDWLVISVS
jgi:hypothetical protein